MSIAASIRKMLAAGLTIDQALTAAEIMEEATSKEPIKSSRQERNRRYYESKLLNSDAYKTVSDDVKSIKTQSDEFKTPKPTEKPRVLPCEENTSLPPKGGISPQTRGTRFGKSGIETIPPEWQTYARTQRLTEAMIHREFEKFKNYWSAKSGGGAVKLDWFAVWRNWALTAASSLPQTPTITPSHAQASPADWPLEKWQKAMDLALRRDRWEPDWGPPPDDPKTLCPQSIRHLWTPKLL